MTGSKEGSCEDEALLRLHLSVLEKVENFIGCWRLIVAGVGGGEGVEEPKARKGGRICVNTVEN